MPRHSAILAIAACFVASSASRADVLWTENAESGAGGITTNVLPANYALIQSSIVGQGTKSFRLANPGFADNWFASNSAFTIQADSKLFFLSRLGFAASGQVARVEMSTNNGATWPISLYAQTGTSTGAAPVESNFALRTIDLSSYVGQSAKFRFNLDYVNGGSAFTQTDPGVGWYVDDIQLAEQFQKSLYSIGQPSAEEQLYLEYINRARADAIVEANRLKTENAPGVQSAYNFFAINPQNIVNQFTTSVANGLIDQFAQPLSFSAALNQAAELHSQDMLAKGFQGHVSSNAPPAPFTSGMTLGQRAQAVGYVGSLGENVYSYSTSVAEGHAAFDVDWGNSSPGDPNYNPAFAGQGMQNPAGHRISIHNNDFKEIGVGLVTGNGPNNIGPQVVTQDFGNAGPGAFITGVVYEDLNANNFYDVGEGRSGVRVDVPGSAYYAMSSLSGGYSIPVTANGVYDVLFSGGGFANYGTSITIAGGLNVKVDYHAIAAPSFAADFNDDGRVDGLDLAEWKGDFGVNAFSDANNDGKTDGADFLVWQRQYGSGVSPTAAVPEPATFALVATALFAIPAGIRGRRR